MEHFVRLKCPTKQTALTGNMSLRGKTALKLDFTTSYVCQHDIQVTVLGV